MQFLPPPYFLSQFLPPPYFLSQFLPPPYFLSQFLPPPYFLSQFLPPPYFLSQFLPPPYFFPLFLPPPNFVWAIPPSYLFCSSPLIWVACHQTVDQCASCFIWHHVGEIGKDTFTHPVVSHPNPMDVRPQEVHNGSLCRLAVTCWLTVGQQVTNTLLTVGGQC